MARKKNAEKQDSGFGGYKFVKHDLTAADKEWLGAASLESEFPVERIFDLVEVGYKVSFSPDFSNMSIVCSITDKQENSAFCKHILSGRGATAVDAWYSLAYRHFHLAQEDWSFFVPAPSEDGDRFS